MNYIKLILHLMECQTTKFGLVSNVEQLLKMSVHHSGKNSDNSHYLLLYS